MLHTRLTDCRIMSTLSTALSTSEQTTLSTTDLAEVVNELRDVADPYNLGLNLGIHPAKVDILLKNDGGDIERQKSKMLKYWLDNDSKASWSTLADALRKSDYVRLAQRLEKTYSMKREVTYTGGI